SDPTASRPRRRRGATPRATRILLPPSWILPIVTARRRGRERIPAPPIVSPPAAEPARIVCEPARRRGLRHTSLLDVALGRGEQGGLQRGDVLRAVELRHGLRDFGAPAQVHGSAVRDRRDDRVL